MFVVHATARPEHVRSAARAPRGTSCAACATAKSPAAEIERARRVLEAQWLRRFESMEGQANHIASWELAGNWMLGGAYLDRLLTTDAGRLADVARRWLAPDLAGLVVYRPGRRAGDRGRAPPRCAARSRPTAPSRSRRSSVPARPTPDPRVEGMGVRARRGAGARVPHGARACRCSCTAVRGALAHLGWFVSGGAAHEPADATGLTSLMTRASLKGTLRRTAQRIAEDAEFLGGVLSTAAAADGFQWTISVPRRRLDEAAELLADVVQRPSFADDAVESERAVALANLAALRDDMYRWPLRLATQAAWGSHPYGRSVLGTEESLAAMDSDALRRWHGKVAIEAPGVLVCVGDVESGRRRVARDAVLRRAARRRWRPRCRCRRGRPRMLRQEDQRDKAQSALAMLFEGPARDDDARFSAGMIAGVASGLGGRFFDELRDRQSLAYTVMAAPVVRRHAGAFSAYIAMSPEKEEAARSGLLGEFARLRESPVTDRELAQAKTYALGTWAIRRESAAAVMGDIADAWLFGRSLGRAHGVRVASARGFGGGDAAARARAFRCGAAGGGSGAGRRAGGRGSDCGRRSTSGAVVRLK